MKIKNLLGKRIMLDYTQKPRDSIDTDALENRIRFARNKIKKWCAEIRDKRLMKKQN